MEYQVLKRIFLVVTIFAIGNGAYVSAFNQNFQIRIGQKLII